MLVGFIRHSKLNLGIFYVSLAIVELTASDICETQVGIFSTLHTMGKTLLFRSGSFLDVAFSKAVHTLSTGWQWMHYYSHTTTIWHYFDFVQWNWRATIRPVNVWSTWPFVFSNAPLWVKSKVHVWKQPVLALWRFHNLSRALASLSPSVITRSEKGLMDGLMLESYTHWSWGPVELLPNSFCLVCLVQAK